MSWAERFQESNLVKGEKAAFVSVLLSQADRRLLGEAAQAAGLAPGVMAARLVSQVLRQNRARFGGSE